MSVYSSRRRPSAAGGQVRSYLSRLLDSVPNQRGLLYAAMIIGALLAFETFNYGTTEYALTDLLGDLRFTGVRWASILAIAFCGIDFAGIARLFTPERGRQEPIEDWCLLGAWFLAATMNAMLTWWAVSLALLTHGGLGNEIIGRESLIRSVPVFVAVLVWLIRVLIIGTLTVAGERLFVGKQLRRTLPRPITPSNMPEPGQGRSTSRPTQRPLRPAPKPAQRREPMYIPDPVAAKPRRRG